jgi:very-short-patch-repair endonuclease
MDLDVNQNPNNLNDGAGKDIPPTDNPKATLLERLRARLSLARDRLVDRNLRNRLISTNLNSSRTKNIRFSNGNSGNIFTALHVNKQDMLFDSIEEDEAEQQSVSRNLPLIDTLPQLPSAESVVISDSSLSSEKSARESNVLLTRLEKISLQKKLKSIYFEAREYEEEQGVNILFVALGFIKWYEDDSSDIERYAPLVLLPVELIRDGAKDKFKLRPREEDLFTNISLKLWLKEQNSIDLPDIPEEDPWSFKEYCDKAREAIKKESRWSVLEDESVLGFFSFNKFLLWRDLDPANWPEGMSLLDHPIIQRLLMPPLDAGEPDPPIISPDELIDDHFTPQDLVYVVDADSSQTEAIQTALAGKNMVIQGPPGTGKSQTITNIIAAAVAQGKKVLFIAEKMAALNVVHDRLTKVGLEVICLELHSRKATKSGVLKQLRDSVEFPDQPRVSDKAFSALGQSQTFLNNHSKSLNNHRDPWGMSPFEVIGEISKLHRQGLNIFNFDIPDSINYSKSRLNDLSTRLVNLSERLKKSGVPCNHPWRMSGAGPLTPMDEERLKLELYKLVSLTTIAEAEIKTANSDLNLQSFDLSVLSDPRLRSLCKLAESLLAPPSVELPLLTSEVLRKNVTLIKSISLSIKTYKHNKAEIAKSFIHGWEQHDLSTLRLKLASSGGSIFSVFSSTYRQSIATLRGLLSHQLPSGFNNRLNLLDKALALKASEVDISKFDPTLKVALGNLWRGEDSDDALLLLLADWHLLFEKLDQQELDLAVKLVGNHPAQLAMGKLSEALNNLNSPLESVCTNLKIAPEPLKEKSFIELVKTISDWLANIDRLNEWPAVRSNLNSLLAEIGQECFDKIYSGEIQADHINAVVRYCILEKIWQSIISSDSYLSEIDSLRLDKELDIFRKSDKDRLKIASKEILGNYSSLKPSGSNGEMGIISQQIKKSRNNLAVRKLIEKAGRAIHELKPVFLMSPMSIAQFIAPGSMTFDLVLIDEASQVKPEDALGAIARARQVVVVGDAKQLPPTNFFNRLTDDSDYEEILDDEGSYLLNDVESILDLCDGVFQSRSMLRWHYRSQHPGLIAVSNRHFYDDELLLPPSVLRANYADGFGVSFVKSPQNGYIRGGSEGGRNILEAELIAKEVIIFAKASPDKSLGVAAFSVTQRDCIRDLIDAERLKHPETETFFSESRPEPFFVKNLESIQGDERDVIFISVGYGRSEDGRLTQTFGPLAAKGGERRLNVLISRAKQRCTVFSSITSEDIKNSSGKIGVNAFKEFLQFAEKGYFDVPFNTEKGFDSDFEESVALFLEQHGYKVQPQVGMSGFFIDIGVIDPNNEAKYYCGIECDGATYHSSRSARDRDRLRQEILESRGWNIYRIWSTDWFHRRQAQEAKLLDYLAALTSTDGPPVEKDPILHDPIDHVDIFVPVESSGPDESIVVPYSEFEERVHSRSAPHELSSYELGKTVKKILEIESPIHQEEIARRVARAFGLEKAGNRIQEATNKALRAISGSESSGQFWRLKEGVLMQVRVRTDVKSRTSLSAKYLPPEEILLGLRYLIKQSVQIEVSELVQQTSKLFGFSRCGPDLKEAILAVIASESSKSIININGMISLAK